LTFEAAAELLSRKLATMPKRKNRLGKIEDEKISARTEINKVINLRKTTLNVSRNNYLQLNLGAAQRQSQSRTK